MFRWHQYSCEPNDQPGHSWMILAGADHLEEEKDCICKHGHDAVMHSIIKPGNAISVRVISCLFLNETSNNSYNKDKYKVLIESLAEGVLSITKQSYAKDEAFEIAKNYCGMRKEDALKIWKKKDLGEIRGDLRIDYE